MVRFGPAGSDGLGTLDGIKKVKKSGLSAVEIEFTYGVKMTDEEAMAIGTLSKNLDVSLSVHAPYYVNLASSEYKKVEDSKKRIISSCKKAHFLEAKYVVFHAGFYQDRTEKETYSRIEKHIADILEIVKQNKWDIVLAPETTGKKSQFGNIDELLKLSCETKCGICVDFAHLLARDGAIDYKKVFDKLAGIKHIHAHFSGIEYTDKGEKKHIGTSKEALMPFLKEIIRRNTDITIINESPTPLLDSKKAQNIFYELVAK